MRHARSVRDDGRFRSDKHDLGHGQDTSAPPEPFCEMTDVQREYGQTVDAPWYIRTIHGPMYEPSEPGPLPARKAGVGKHDAYCYDRGMGPRA